jgi:hypothetical protein
VVAASSTYTTEAIETLVKIMRSLKSADAARVAACKEILDRGHGKAPQALLHSGNINLTHEQALAALNDDDADGTGDTPPAS